MATTLKLAPRKPNTGRAYFVSNPRLGAAYPAGFERMESQFRFCAGDAPRRKVRAIGRAH